VARPTAATILPRLLDEYRSAADPEAAGSMSAYMRDRMPFFGIGSKPRRALDREVVAGLEPPTEAEVAEVLRACWAEDEREVQYFACDWTRKHVRRLSPSFLPVVEEAVTHRSWWDTVDALAGSVDRLVFAHRELRAEMDRWLHEDDLWLRRVALIHQLRWKADADVDWIEAACLDRAHETDFFIRKAIGWALREVSKQDEQRVRTFVAEHDAELSGLSKREALMWLKRRDARLARLARGAQAEG
jgi:3-methyladenine DNA glycosylase AlkD